MSGVGVYPGVKAVLFCKLRLETPNTGKRRKAMYTDTWQSVYIRLPRGREAGPTAYIYASRVETVMLNVAPRRTLRR